MALPSTVHWSAISTRGMEIAKQIGLRAGAGLDSREIALHIEAHRDELKYLEPPPGGGPITVDWVNRRLRELREEIEEVGAAEF